MTPATVDALGPSTLDGDVLDLAAQAPWFAATAPRDKAALLRATLATFAACGPAIVEAGCQARGIAPSSPVAGEEWLTGVVPVLRFLRGLASALDEIASRGRPALDRKAVRARRDGRVTVDLLRPGSLGGGLGGLASTAWLVAGSRADAVAQARFYATPAGEGEVTLVLGAGDLASTPVIDALDAMFVRGSVVLLKLSPAHDALGPVLERALAPLVARGALRIVVGDADVGAHLAHHPRVARVHLTGAAATREQIVWGQTESEREARRLAGTPRLTKPLTCALGGVAPVIVAPFLHAKDELWYQARSVASQLVLHGSFHGTAPRVLVLPGGWPQRDLFVGMLRTALDRVPPRPAYHPGAIERHAALTAGREGAPRAAAPGRLPWTIVERLDARDAGEPLFADDPFCGILAEVSVGIDEPAAFLAAATAFCRERLAGSLAASIVVHPLLEERAPFVEALDRAIMDLPHATVAINAWPGLGRLAHDTRMLEGVEKVVLRAPLRAVPRPWFFCDRPAMASLGARAASHASAPTWGKALGLAVASLRG